MNISVTTELSPVRTVLLMNALFVFWLRYKQRLINQSLLKVVFGLSLVQV